MERFFPKKQNQRLDFIDTTRTSNISIIDDGDTNSTAGWTDTVWRDGNEPLKQSSISDADGDTIVNTEESEDEDKIRFDTGGSERFRMEANDTNGGALYIKEGSGTTAPSTPSSGEGVFYEKNDGKIYFKNDGGTEYDLTSGGGGGMSSFDITGDSGSAQTVTDGNTVDIEGGTGINTVAGATDKITVNCDLEGTELKSTGETGGSKFLREDGDGTCSWQTVSAGGGGTVQGTDHTYDIEATNQGATTGNARGENSVDLQTERSSAAMVASGSNSGIIAGSNNTAVGTHSFIGGGNTNYTGGIRSAVVGGASNSAVGSDSVIVGGDDNSITSGGQKGTIVGGADHTMTALNSTIVGGQFNRCDSVHSIAMGQYAKTKRLGEMAIGGADGTTFTVGESQSGMAIWSGRTTNNSATELYLNNSGSGRFTLDTDSAVTFEIQLTAVDESNPSGINAGATFFGTIVNDSGTTALGGQGSVTKTANPSTAFATGGADADVTADNTNNSLKITVTGITGKNMRWVCSMRYTEVAI